MKTKRQKARRLSAHIERMRVGHDRKHAHNVYACRETAALHQAEGAGRSTIADDGLNKHHDNMAGIAIETRARRISNRYGAMLPLARVRSAGRDQAQRNAAIAAINKIIKGMSQDAALHDVIHKALSAPLPTQAWELLQWRLAYHSQRLAWLKSTSAKNDAQRGVDDAMRDLKRLNETNIKKTNLSLALEGVSW